MKASTPTRGNGNGTVAVPYIYDPNIYDPYIYDPYFEKRD
jgi:hypothetical protein